MKSCFIFPFCGARDSSGADGGDCSMENPIPKSKTETGCACCSVPKEEVSSEGERLPKLSLLFSSNWVTNCKPTATPLEGSETAAPEEQVMGLCLHPARFGRLSINHRGLLTKPKLRSIICMGEWLWQLGSSATSFQNTHRVSNKQSSLRGHM